MDAKTLEGLILEAGIVGAGGAGFPTHVKLISDMHYLIINGAECEPLLYTDERLLTHYGERLIDTLHEILAICHIQEGIIALKEKYPHLLNKLATYAQRYDNITIKPVDNIYPIGDEMTLIHACTGLTVARGALPSSQGVVEMNVETLLNIHNKLHLDLPVTHTHLTLTGDVQAAKVYYVPLGTKIKDFLDLVGESYEGKLILLGGPMMGSFVSADTYITKTTKGIILLPEGHHLAHLKARATTKSVKRAMSSCSQCRMCTDLCPRNRLGHKVEPHKVMNAFANGILNHYEGIETALGCCGCNLCSYFSCHHDLSPGTLMTEVKRELLKGGVKSCLPSEAPKEASYLKVPATRLKDRLGLSRYDQHAVLEEVAPIPQYVTIPLQQHIGQPANSIVNRGDRVEVGQLIATKSEKGLGSNIHSSLTGTVSCITATAISIERRA